MHITSIVIFHIYTPHVHSWQCINHLTIFWTYQKWEDLVRLPFGDIPKSYLTSITQTRITPLWHSVAHISHRLSTFELDIPYILSSMAAANQPSNVRILSFARFKSFYKTNSAPSFKREAWCFTFFFRTLISSSFSLSWACNDSSVLSRDTIFFLSFLISHACEICLGLEDSLKAFVEGRGFFCTDGSASGDSGRGLWGLLVWQAVDAVAARFWLGFDCARIVWRISTAFLLSDVFVYLIGSILKKERGWKDWNWCYERLLLLSIHHDVSEKNCAGVFFSTCLSTVRLHE